jgi:hypothetical protein
MPLFFGLYRALVRDNADPMKRGRLKVEVAEVAGSESLWAEACAGNGPFGVPPPGRGVWVAFEGGDPRRPVWLGEIVGQTPIP